MKIALIAHDKKKSEMIEFTTNHKDKLTKYELVGTGTTGRMISEATGLEVKRYLSGPYGGDQQIGALVVQQEIDLIIFLRDPLTSQAHETDIQALIRLCDVYHVPIATNLASAEIFIKALDRGEFSFRDVRKTESQRI